MIKRHIQMSAGCKGFFKLCILSTFDVTIMHLAQIRHEYSFHIQLASLTRS